MPAMKLATALNRVPPGRREGGGERAGREGRGPSTFWPPTRDSAPLSAQPTTRRRDGGIGGVRVGSFGAVKGRKEELANVKWGTEEGGKEEEAEGK